MPLSGLKIGFLGGGAMAGAILAGLLKKGIFLPENIYITDISTARLKYLQDSYGVNTSQDNTAVVPEVDIMVLAVKPQITGAVLKEIAGVVKPDQTLVSIAAGISTAMLESYLNTPLAVVRVMPNTPALVGEGVSALCPGSQAGPGDMDRAMAIFNAVGRAVELPEHMMDAVTGLSGSGPAYMFLILEALSDAGVKVGLPRDAALLLAAQTMLGSARMLIEAEGHPAKMKEMVTTPGGTTIEGLYALEQAGLRGTLMKAVEAATRRSRELASGIKS
ncbi:MAG: Pyrroline-5-carboxylate reductase [Peptococcaceae bacterium BRH_c4b]|nr:MAG: Pyrroline-5-carboxylate reductase [Peptococcaceae bacterium BRH_c4b]